MTKMAKTTMTTPRVFDLAETLRSDNIDISRNEGAQVNRSKWEVYYTSLSCPMLVDDISSLGRVGWSATPERVVALSPRGGEEREEG